MTEPERIYWRSRDEGRHWEEIEPPRPTSVVGVALAGKRPLDPYDAGYGYLYRWTEGTPDA